MSQRLEIDVVDIFRREEGMKDAVNISATDQRSISQQEKKPYVRPQLADHGKVESLTQQSNDGPSGGPIDC
jgi:hypothetical protein